MKLSKKQVIAVIKLKRRKRLSFSKFNPAAGVTEAQWTFNPEGKSSKEVHGRTNVA